MSVLKSKRTLSRNEYVNTFIKLYKHTEEKLSKMAKRKRRFLADPIITIMNDIFNDITEINNQYFNYGIKLINEKERSDKVIEKLLSLQKPLLALWSIEEYKDSRMITWAELIDEEIRYIARLGALPNNKGKYMFILDFDTIRKVEFLNNMWALHKFIYSKVISLPTKYRDTTGMQLKELADEAFYHLAEANRFVPTNRAMYENRKKHIDIAFDRIRKMQIPVINLFLEMEYSEQIMIEWSFLIDKEMKLLNGVIKSDAKRFGDLT